MAKICTICGRRRRSVGPGGICNFCWPTFRAQLDDCSDNLETLNAKATATGSFLVRLAATEELIGALLKAVDGFEMRGFSVFDPAPSIQIGVAMAMRQDLIVEEMRAIWARAESRTSPPTPVSERPTAWKKAARELTEIRTALSASPYGSIATIDDWIATAWRNAGVETQ